MFSIALLIDIHCTCRTVRGGGRNLGVMGGGVYRRWEKRGQEVGYPRWCEWEKCVNGKNVWKNFEIGNILDHLNLDT